jgi:hypothetical protein
LLLWRSEDCRERLSCFRVKAREQPLAAGGVQRRKGRAEDSTQLLLGERILKTAKKILLCL